MTKTQRTAASEFRVALLIVVLAGLIGGMVYVLRAPPPRPAATQPMEIPELMTNRQRTTEVYFPLSARCEDREVNLFVVKFLQILLDEDYAEGYKQYRENVTRLRQPKGQRAFDEAHYKATRIDLKSIAPIADAKEMGIPELAEVPPPIYRVTADVLLRDQTKRSIEVYVFQEDGRWVSSH